MIYDDYKSGVLSQFKIRSRDTVFLFPVIAALSHSFVEWRTIKLSKSMVIRQLKIEVRRRA
jgi:hypothetical protein